MSKQRQSIKERLKRFIEEIQKRNTAVSPLEYHASISPAEADVILAGEAEWDKYAGDLNITVIGPETYIMGSRPFTRWKKPVGVNGKALIGKGDKGFYAGMAYISRAEEGEGPDYHELDLFLEFYLKPNDPNHLPGPLERKMKEIGAEWTDIPNGVRNHYIW